MSNNTGGPAFPQDGAVWRGSAAGGKGMSLRDYFAAKAMQAIISRLSSAQYHYIGAESVASDAYMIADGMLKEREK